MSSAQAEVANVGLIAGGGSFPFEVARAARAQGHRVICAGIRQSVDPSLAAEVDVFRRVNLGRLGAFFRLFHRHDVHRLVWAGFIRKERTLSLTGALQHVPDLRALRFWFFRLRGRDKQAQTLLTMLANEFEDEGFKLTESTEMCPELLVGEGLLTSRGPSKRQRVDIAFGWKIAKRMADLDVGQSVVVYDRSTVAVEGVEGTDRNILRAGELCRGAFTVVKVAMDKHDMRFDVPTIGPDTVETMAKAGGAVLAIEAGKTILLDRERTIEAANRAKIVIIALRDGETG